MALAKCSPGTLKVAQKFTSCSYGSLPLMFSHTPCRPETKYILHFQELYNLFEAHERQLLSVLNLFFVSLAKTFNDDSNALTLLFKCYHQGIEISDKWVELVWTLVTHVHLCEYEEDKMDGADMGFCLVNKEWYIVGRGSHSLFMEFGSWLMCHD